jgi:hypothetical protein
MDHKRNYTHTIDHYLYIYKHGDMEISLADKFNMVWICCKRLCTEMGPQIVKLLIYEYKSIHTVCS